MYNDFKERYSRNILLDEISHQGQEKLRNSKVLVAGAGGLGSTVLANLAGLGVGNIGIVDSDRVDVSNLNRQFIHKYANISKPKTVSAEEWIKSYNPDIKVDKYNIRLTYTNSSEIIDKYDVVIDCFDSYKSKFELNNICVKHEKPLVHAGVTEYSGQVMSIIPGKTACLYCIFTEPELESYILKGIISPTVTFAASVQSSEAVKILLNLNKNLLTDCLFSFNLLDNEFRKIKMEKNPKCPACS